VIVRHPAAVIVPAVADFGGSRTHASPAIVAVPAVSATGFDETISVCVRSDETTGAGRLLTYARRTHQPIVADDWRSGDAAVDACARSARVTEFGAVADEPIVAGFR